MSASAYRVQLQTPDWAVQATLTPPEAPVPLGAWLPFLQALADKAAAVAAERAEAQGKRVSCGKGCGACCRQVIAISLVEAKALAELVEAMPAQRRRAVRARFAAGLARLAESGVAERDHSAPAPAFPLAETAQQRLGAAWFQLAVACPFLVDEACSIYDERPLVCREHQVTSPAAACARLYREPVERLPMPTSLSQSVARATAKLDGVAATTIPLMMSLQLTPQIDAALAQQHDAIEMLQALLSEIGDWSIEAAG